MSKVAWILDIVNKKIQVSKVAQGARFRDYRGCVEWLEDGIKLTGGNIGCRDGINTFPSFYAFLLKRYLKQKNK